ncbi:hypothetical protein D0X99_13895 [Algoriphagus lacus]|uniref:Uncharacterized protein n=1 Tax=Algoriphagus lacus TaxID=2056311 RepID=A0A418PQM0_9BACT|nr:hypothetical protein [Algoriphagus lacus]RIW14627.1 hypothetical protein D0X99_13895 [Algoriphagus lacus]
MKNSTIFRFRGSFFGLLFVLVFAYGCSMDGDQNEPDMNLNEDVAKRIASLSDSPDYMNELIDGLKRTAPDKYTPGVDLFAKSNKKWVAMASGGGTINQSTFFFNGYVISFQAKEDSEGMDVGVIQFSDTEGNYIGEGAIDCLTVDGNRAFIRFVVDGSYYFIGFEDNGEGSNATPDVYTDTAISLIGSALSCEEAEQIFLDFYGGYYKEWTEGNVQVH